MELKSGLAYSSIKYSQQQCKMYLEQDGGNVLTVITVGWDGGRGDLQTSE